MATLELRPGDPESQTLPVWCRTRDAAAGGGAVCFGDLTGQADRWVVLRRDGSVVAGDTMAGLSGLLRQERPALDPWGISAGLQHGFIPPPGSAFQGVYVLGIGDTLKVSPGLPPEHRFDFPYFGEASRQDSDPDPACLLRAMAASLEKLIAGHNDVTLMLSAGKDSTAIALALAELGRKDVRCVTYKAGTEADEHEFAAVFAEKLGLPHEVVDLPDSDKSVRAMMDRYFEQSPRVCLDCCLPSYLACLDSAGVSGGLVIDGMGSDVYIGHVAGEPERVKFRRNLGGPFRRGRGVVGGWFGHASAINFVLQPRASLCVPGYYHRYAEARRFYPDAVDTTGYWDRLGEALTGRDHFDYRAVARGCTYDSRSCSLKARAAAYAFGAEAVFPWASAQVIDYVFHLPEADRFDRGGWVNKTQVRRLLNERLDYDQVVRGKHAFQFDTAGFLEKHRAYVQEQVAGCGFWARGVATRFDRELDGIGSRPTLATGVMNLFLLSGWLNRHAG